MLRSDDKYKSTIGFIDLLFNLLIGFAFLFIIAFLLIKPESKEQDFERKAEFVITMEWDQKRYEDMDLWVQDPTGYQVSYRSPVVNFMHLDKDDLGKKNDQVLVGGKLITVDINREVVTIRGIIPGEYIVNAHLYSTHVGTYLDGEKVLYPQRGTKFPVTVEVTKVNPVYKILWQGEYEFKTKGQERTFYRFKIDHDGDVVDFNFIEKKFIKPWGGTDPESASTGRHNPITEAEANAEP